MTSKRTPLRRPPLVRITPEAVALFRRGLRLIRRGDEDRREYLDVCYKLDRVLGLRPWQEPVLNTVGFDIPPDWMDSEPVIADWHRSANIRRQLEAALAAARKVKRARRDAAASSPPDQRPPS